VSCCAGCTATANHFGAEVARRDLERYLKKGPDRTTRSILTAVRSSGLTDATLLDVGAGIGVLQHELLDNGFKSATYVEVSPAYLAMARQESDARGHAGRVRFVQGDIVTVASGLTVADVVTLNRVICCYADCISLVKAASSRARAIFVCSLPRDRLLVRWVSWLRNWLRRVRGEDFQSYVHPPTTIEATLNKCGFRKEGSHNSFVWHTMLFCRVNESSSMRE